MPDDGGRGRRGVVLVGLAFVLLAAVNLAVLVQANQLAFSQAQQPYDFYVLLHASSQVFSAPSLVYAHQGPGALPGYWAGWLWNGASYLYTPMFAVLLSPLSSLNPPEAKVLWESMSYALLLVACLAVLTEVPSPRARLFVMLMVLIMPFQVIYTDQALPQYWLPQMPTMWVSPVFFADYYWGNSNTFALAVGLLSYYFAVRKGAVDLGFAKIPGPVFSSLFLAVDTFKPSVALLILPFWILMNRGRVPRAVGLLVGFTAALNVVAVAEPSLVTGYISALLSAPRADLWQVYEYVWYYTLPVVGVVLLWLGRPPVQVPGAK